jgi:hypothetical protein
VFTCHHAIQKSKYKDENRGCETEQEEEFVSVERNQTKYSVLKIENCERYLAQTAVVMCASHVEATPATQHQMT